MDVTGVTNDLYNIRKKSIVGARFRMKFLKFASRHRASTPVFTYSRNIRGTETLLWFTRRSYHRVERTSLEELAGIILCSPREKKRRGSNDTFRLFIFVSAVLLRQYRGAHDSRNWQSLRVIFNIQLSRNIVREENLAIQFDDSNKNGNSRLQNVLTIERQTKSKIIDFCRSKYFVKVII